MKPLECGFIGKNASSELSRVGPTILADIGLDEHWVPGTGSIPVPGLRDVRALVDTGAAACFIDHPLAVKLNLPIVNRRELAGTQGKQEINMHMTQLHIKKLRFTKTEPFGAIYLRHSGLPYDLIIGRTLLEHFMLVYNGRTGHVTLSLLGLAEA